MLQQVKKSLLVEANQSPNLLADLAGLETYIAESYDARSFIELMQNADDAGANRFHAEHFGGILIVACLLYTSPSPRDQRGSRMPSSA